MKARRKAEEAETPLSGKRGRRAARSKEKLDVQLTVRFNFGDEPRDHVTVINQRSVPMVGSVLVNRDRIVRGFLSLLLKTAMLQPRVVRELFPYLPLRKRPQAKSKR
ncbi:hypothetical protein [Solimonas aquatica]|nr:hypothetical protein [Solimonas aquatica]